MTFTSIEQIREVFQLENTQEDEIKAHLRRKLAETHPDKVGNESFDIEEFEKIKSALDFINKPVTDIVTTEQVTDLIKIVKDLTTTSNSNSIERQLNEKLDSFYKERKDALLFPKISLSAVTAILSFLWLFPQTIADHPILSQYINFDNITSTIIWLSLLFYTVFFWILISRKEHKEKNLSKSLKTDRTQNNILTDFQESSEERKFTKSDLTDFILERFGYRRQSSILALFMGRPGVDQETGESVADYIISKAVSKNLIEHLSNSHSLEDYYIWKN